MAHEYDATEDAFEQFESEEWGLLRQSLSGARSYLEFGCGLSTEFVSKRFKCQVRSIETSQEWVTRIREKVPLSTEVIHVDLGPIGEWGRPLTYDFRERFFRYFEAGFDKGYQPDVVFVDGRFRVACFLTSLMMSAPGTRIVIDDYPMRLEYKVVENIVSPISLSSRQALFIRPEEIDVQEVLALRDSFANVMD